MEVMTIDSNAYRSLTEQLAEIVRFVRMANETLQEKSDKEELKPMMSSDEAARMLGISKRTLQRMRSTGSIEYMMVRGQCRYSVPSIHKLIEERTIAKET